MAFSRQLGVIGILGACFFVAVGCDDDGDKIPMGGAGEGGDDAGGDTGKGGKSTGGSSSGNAGKGGTSAGTANDGGFAGDAGSGPGPSGGMAGEGGTATSGGGGAGAGAGGDAGGGGEGGGGDGPGPVPAQCSYGCEDDDDCQFTDAPPTHSCDPETKTCLQCKTDAACLPVLSFWLTECADDTGCPETDACVAWQGKGYCAYKADPQEPETSCLGFGGPKTLPRLGAQGEVMVCAAPDPRCIQGACGPGCASDELSGGGCGQGNGDTCSSITGLCECTLGTECTDSGVCGADGHCGCANDDDCTAPGLDKCLDGVCVCASTDSCNAGFTNATPVCE